VRGAHRPSSRDCDRRDATRHRESPSWFGFVCHAYMNGYGNCHYGSTCRYDHPREHVENLSPNATPYLMLANVFETLA
jgi:hypothetical protein